MLNRAIICASGNSIAEGLQKSLINAIENECTFIINFNHHYMKGTVNTFCDIEFYNQEKSHLDKCGLVIGKNNPHFNTIYPVGDNVILLEAAGRYFGKKSFQRGVYSGALTGLFTLTTAIALGFKEIFLLGYDFAAINGKTHFYQGNKEGIGIVKKEAGEPGAYREASGVGFEPSNHEIYKTGCYNRPASELFNAYHPCEFMDIDLSEVEWLEILKEFHQGKSEFMAWLPNYVHNDILWKFFQMPDRIKERNDYIAFYEFKKVMVDTINRMIYDLGMDRVTEIFYPYLCEWYGLRKELQGIKIINVSPLSKINTFPKMEYDFFFKYLKDNPVNVNQEEARNEIKSIIERNK